MDGWIAWACACAYARIGGAIWAKRLRHKRVPCYIFPFPHKTSLVTERSVFLSLSLSLSHLSHSLCISVQFSSILFTPIKCFPSSSSSSCVNQAPLMDHSIIVGVMMLKNTELASEEQEKEKEKSKVALIACKLTRNSIASSTASITTGRRRHPRRGRKLKPRCVSPCNQASTSNTTCVAIRWSAEIISARVSLSEGPIVCISNEPPTS